MCVWIYVDKQRTQFTVLRGVKSVDPETASAVENDEDSEHMCVCKGTGKSTSNALAAAVCGLICIIQEIIYYIVPNNIYILYS